MTLYLECKPDEALVLAPRVPKRSVIHCGGKGAVCNSLAIKTGVVGMVDEDPMATRHRYLSHLLDQGAREDVRLLVDAKQNNRLVVLCPRFEEWILSTTKRTGLQMPDYGLSENPQELHAEINQRVDNLQRLVSALVEARSIAILRLKSLLVA